MKPWIVVLVIVATLQTLAFHVACLHIGTLERKMEHLQMIMNDRGIEP